MPKDILTEIGYTYGSFNAVQKKKSQPIYSPNSDPLDLVSSHLRDRFKNNGLQGITQFKAIVLRVENPIGEDEDPALGWADSLSDMLKGVETEEIRLVSIKAMIPEIHASILPVPKSLGTEDGQDADHSAINKYPTFTAQHGGIDDPKPGEVVWVTFEDIENLNGGILLGGMKPDENDTSGDASAKGAFGPCGNKFGARSAKGLKLANINVNVVGNFPDLKGVNTPVNPSRDKGKLPVGKGLFTNMTANPNRFPVDRAVKAGLDWVAVLGLWQRSHHKNEAGKKDTVAKKEQLKNFVNAFHSKGIRVYLWAFPNIQKYDELVSFIFPLAHEVGAIGVIYDPEDGLLGNKYKVEQGVQLTLDWMRNSMSAARRYGLCCGVTSYEIPHWIHPKMMPYLKAMADGGADFVMAQSYRANPNYKPKGMIKGIKSYKECGFKNILAFGGLYGPGRGGASYQPFYPQYETKKKPPEEIVRRTGWLFGETAQSFIDYKKAITFWSWEAANSGAAKWPQQRWVTVKNMADSMERLKNNPGDLNPPMSAAEKEAADASAAEKEVKQDNPTQQVQNSEKENVDASTTAQKADEASQAKENSPPQLTNEQQEKLDSLRTDVAAKKSTVEQTEEKIEGMTSTSLPGSPAQAAAAAEKAKLKTQQADLKKAEDALKAYEKELGIKSQSVQPTPTSVSPSAGSTGCGNTTGLYGSAGGGTSKGNWAGPPNGGTDFENLKEYIYDNTKITIEPASYKENRVRNGNYPQKFLNPNLVVTYGGKQVHKLAAKRIEMMNAAWARDTGKRKFRLASGLREPGEQRYAWLRARRGQNYPSVKKALAQDPNISTAALFDLFLIDRYGDVRRGRVYRAYNSAHETGLAFDISYGNASPEKWIPGSMGPYSKTNGEQKKGRLFQWLRKNAHKFGIFPYKGEAWHWEIQLTRKAWYTGEDFVTDGNYAVNVIEESTKHPGILTNDKAWSGKAFE